ncbi:hypothetical protein N7488_005687 [Penicillium malachiteum]|nr:hypothetical protein N7488_005687 [Penicillium malachiteum]
MPITPYMTIMRVFSQLTEKRQTKWIEILEREGLDADTFKASHLRECVKKIQQDLRAHNLLANLLSIGKKT